MTSSMDAKDTYWMAMRDQWLRANQPSMRRLAEQTGVGHATVHNVINGPALSGWEPTQLVAEALRADVEKVRELWMAAKMASNMRGPRPRHHRSDGVSLVRLVRDDDDSDAPEREPIAEALRDGLADIAAAIRGLSKT